MFVYDYLPDGYLKPALGGVPDIDDDDAPICWAVDEIALTVWIVLDVIGAGGGDDDDDWDWDIDDILIEDDKGIAVVSGLLILRVGVDDAADTGATDCCDVVVFDCGAHELVFWCCWGTFMTLSSSFN